MFDNTSGPKIYNTLIPYRVLPDNGIEYNVCRDYEHISRYKGLRQIAHNPDIDSQRYITLETPNIFTSNTEVLYHEVQVVEENRLDLIAYKYFGSASYSWIIAYFNSIQDGFTVRPGQTLVIPKSLSALFNTGEVLAAIPVTSLNLGTE